MKKVMTAVATLALLGTTASTALAQDGQWRGGRGDGGGRGQQGDPQGARQGGDNGGYNPAMRRSYRNNPDNVQPAAPAPAPAPQPQAQAPQPPQAQAAPAARDPDRYNGARNDGDRGGRDQRYEGRRDGQRYGDRDYRGGEDRGRYEQNRGWNDNRRDDRPRYDRRAYPPVYRTDRRYEGPRYRPPSGFYVRSWSYGQILPRAWYGPQYRLSDWWIYDLPIPPLGYEWVRVGDDVLLVDTFTGRVVQVVHNLFW